MLYPPKSEYTPYSEATKVQRATCQLLAFGRLGRISGAWRHSRIFDQFLELLPRVCYCLLLFCVVDVIFVGCWAFPPSLLCGVVVLYLFGAVAHVCPCVQDVFVLLAYLFMCLFAMLFARMCVCSI